jgi:hypothetical protein
MVNPTSSPVISINELPLKLARKCLDVFGTASFDEDASIHTIHSGCDEEIVFIAAGKDFGLARTNSGKVGAKVEVQSALQLVYETVYPHVIVGRVFLIPMINVLAGINCVYCSYTRFVL